VRATGGLRKQRELGVKSKVESSTTPSPTLGTLPLVGLLAGCTLPLVGSLAGCGGGGHEAHSGPSTPIGIRCKW